MTLLLKNAGLGVFAYFFAAIVALLRGYSWFRPQESILVGSVNHL